jgi:hypothetical protein
MNPSRSWLAGIVVGIASVCLLTQAGSGASGSPTTDVIALSQQVRAMQRLHDLDPSAEQLQAIKALASQTIAPAGVPEATKVSPKYLQALIAMKAALSKADNDDEITDAKDALDEIEDDEDVDLDDLVDITAAARANATAILLKFSAAQIADYLGTLGDDAPDLDETVSDALDDVRDASRGEVDEVINDDTEEAGILVAGLDLEKSAELRKQFSEILASSRKLSNSGYAKQRPELEESLKKLIAGTDSFVLLRHSMERDLANLLSNPQLLNAIDAMPK